jgi:hypothetical protein
MCVRTYVRPLTLWGAAEALRNALALRPHSTAAGDIVSATDREQNISATDREQKMGRSLLKNCIKRPKHRMLIKFLCKSRAHYEKIEIRLKKMLLESC